MQSTGFLAGSQPSTCVQRGSGVSGARRCVPSRKTTRSANGTNASTSGVDEQLLHVLTDTIGLHQSEAARLVPSFAGISPQDLSERAAALKARYKVRVNTSS